MTTHNLLFMKPLRSITFLVALFLLTVSDVSAQEVMRVLGTVVVKSDGSPCIGVNVSDASTRRVLAMTDVDGTFAINVRSNARLRFSMVGMKTKEVDVKGKSRLRVVLEEESVSLKEVTISQKRITDKILPEPTDIEVRGNYFHVKTRVRVPREMFSHNTRLVVQPVLNNATRKQVTLMKPMVYDAREYNETQDRLYNFDLNDSLAGDPLARYITVKSEQTREKGRPNDIIGYNDSIYVEHVKDDFSCDVYMAIENYNRILYRDTTIIARGTVNPLRFLDYSFAAHELTDSAYFPKKEVQLRDSQGKVNLRFPVGMAVFDSNDPQNASEIDKLRQQIETISQSKGASLSSLELRGQSSPEGRYSRNMSLAKMRMDYALGFLKRTLPADMTQGMTFTSDAKVAPWSRVAEILRKDTLASEADRVEAILAAHPGNIEAQGRAIQRLPFYHKIIATRCLPQLRRVDYTLHYNVYRTLTIDEIAQLYAQDYSQLSKYEFFKLYRAEADTAKRVAMMRHERGVPLVHGSSQRPLCAAHQPSSVRRLPVAPLRRSGCPSGSQRQPAHHPAQRGPLCLCRLRGPFRQRQRVDPHHTGRQRRSQQPLRCQKLRHHRQDRQAQRGGDAPCHEARRRSPAHEPSVARQRGCEPLSPCHLSEPYRRPHRGLRGAKTSLRHGPLAQGNRQDRRRRDRPPVYG